MLKEFREFIMRGNVVDLAVGLVIGAAFTAVVNSLVKDIIMPPVGMLLKGVDFTNLYISLDGQTYPSLAVAQAAGAPTLNYGIFINTLITFLITALVIFFIVKTINKLRRQSEPAPAAPTTKDCPFCATAIPLQAKRCPNCTSQL
jgi:large conductance mechanosensitive channel